MNSALRPWLAALSLIACAAGPAAAQSMYTWNATAAATDWFTPNNWTGGAVGTYPGVSNAPNGGNFRDVATFAGTNYNTAGINLDNANGPSLSLGAIVVTGTNPLFVGNSSATPNLTGRVLILNTSFPTDDVLLAAIGGDLTIQPNVAGGAASSPMGVQLAFAQGVLAVAQGRTMTISSVISQAPGVSAQLNVQGGGTLVLSGANTYSGPISVNSGFLSVNSINADPTIPQPLGVNTGPIALGSANAAGALTYTGSTPASLSRSLVVGIGGAGIVSSTSTLTIGGPGVTIEGNGSSLSVFGSGDIILNAPIRGFGTNVTKFGAGTLTYAAGVDQAYTGPTFVTGGRLLVNGTLNSPVTVGNGTPNTGTLGGSGGQILQSVTVLNGGTLHGGASPGILTINNSITMTTGANFGADVNGAAVGAQYSQVVQATMGQLSINGASLLVASTATPGDLPGGTVIELLKYLATDGSKFAGLPDGSEFTFTSSGLPAGFFFTSTINYGTLPLFLNSVTLSSIVPVPEPLHILAVSAVGAAGFGWYRKRRKS